MTLEQVLAAWRANNVINHELLALCSDEDLELKPGKGKTIRSNYVHIVGIRRAHVESCMKDAAATVPALDWKTATRSEIESALDSSAAAIEKMFERIETTGKPARWTAPLFLAYNIAHEANHRSQIEIALRLNGREPSNAKLYELWNWTAK